ncbi:CMD1 [Symbiodinium sp. CCMP2592]|nr:CMD1 [Symbiodinium sp. CCMP2592]|mmetsp:Transcript_103604/g.144308  ORF Transcript_103604/g.144308 Transcript_103604/m.144308 type:complete len:207 (-) Transcript_103604:42-662(-)
MAMQKQQASAGVSFTTDLSNIGSGRQTQIFNATQGGVLAEERRLIDKVFSIVDKDNSGQVDIEELKGMFKLFNVEASFLDSAISRIMSNVDKDLDYMISPQEFYQLLSQKFEKEDSEEEMKTVFRRMDKNGDGHLDFDELHEVATMLGESIPKSEIKDMVKMFNKKYQADMAEYTKAKRRGDKPKEPSAPASITEADFLAVMKTDL